MAYAEQGQTFDINITRKELQDALAYSERHGFRGTGCIRLSNTGAPLLDKMVVSHDGKDPLDITDLDSM